MVANHHPLALTIHKSLHNHHMLVHDSSKREIFADPGMLYVEQKGHPLHSLWASDQLEVAQPQDVQSDLGRNFDGIWQ